MKFIFMFVFCIAGITLATAVSKAECLYNNFKFLFNNKNQQFVYQFLEMSCNDKHPEMCELAKEMDVLGDEVLVNWNKCKECPLPPCRVPFLSDCSQGSHKMQSLIHRYVSATTQHAGSKTLVKKVKKIADRILNLNKKALEC